MATKLRWLTRSPVKKFEKIQIIRMRSKQNHQQFI